MANMINQTTVSILMMTYRQEEYIRESVEGVLMQKCNFEIELIIADDKSPDNTEFIVNDIIKNHPKGNIIKYTKHTVNKGMMGNFFWILAQGSGKYIALCESDDYWTDPLKLQKQVDFMETNKDCSLCFHASKHVDIRNPDDFYIHRPKKEIPEDDKFEMKDAILRGGGFVSTGTMLFIRKYTIMRPEWIERTPVGDIPLVLLLASKGKLGYIDDVMSVSRRMSSPTSWSVIMQNSLLLANQHGNAMFKMWTDFDNWSNRKYHKYVILMKLKNKKMYLKRSLKYFLIKLGIIK